MTITADSGIGAAGISTTTFTLTVNNVAPSASFDADFTTINEGGQVIVSFANQSDPSGNDTAAGFRYAYACDGSSLAGATYAASGTTASKVCVLDDNATSPYTIRARIIDKDEGFTEFTKTVTVNDVAPIATFNVLSAANEGAPVAVSFTNPLDPSQADTTAGFHYAFGCDGNFAALPTAYAAAGTTPSSTLDGPETMPVASAIPASAMNATLKRKASL